MSCTATPQNTLQVSHSHRPKSNHPKKQKPKTILNKLNYEFCVEARLGPVLLVSFTYYNLIGSFKSLGMAINRYISLN